ncbi:MAG TPA: T9SS type A sorting domain-containing protein, partial [Salinivirgaceae bacterium]|nr:T9SS type A sorting domain-containing protein [Salinivirgaceae bacterium]
NFELIPTYTVTFTVIDNTSSPIESATIVINSETLATDASGVATIILENGIYPYTISKSGYVSVTGTAVVDGADVSINKTLIYQEYSLTLVANPTAGGTVNDVSGNYQPYSNITVIATPAEGYNFVNWTKDGVEVNTNAEFVYVMPSENVTLTANFEITYTVTFIVYYTLGGPIEGATIVVHGDTLTTDSTGRATINLPNGEYYFVLSMPGHSDFDGAFVVNNEDVDVFVAAPAQYFTITFHSEYNGTPLQGVTINVDGGELTTDEQGNATTELVNGNYTFTATKEGYSDLEGEFTVNDAEQTIILNMTGVEGAAENIVRLYPNPVESIFTIERNISDEVVIEIYNSGGSLMSTTKTESAITNIDVETLASGTYLIRIIGTNNTTVHRFIKR